MKYLCFCYYDTKKFSTLSQEDMKAVEDECKPHDAALRTSGKLVIQGSLSQPESWKSIRPTNDRPSIADGPFSGAQEQVGAFLIVEADNIDEATRIASLHPGAHLGKYFGGGIEVRACEMFEQY